MKIIRILAAAAGVVLLLSCSTAREDEIPEAADADQPVIAAPEPRSGASLADLVSDTREASLTTRAQVQAVIDWTHRHLEWTVTDYEDRSVAAILERGGGNCAEQASVVRAALKEMGIKTRRIREINLHTDSARRGEDAARLVNELGPRASVFGRGHNDHVWIEYWDEQLQDWAPADPTLNLVGYETWVKARLGFGERPVHAILPSRDMIAPIVVAAETGDPEAPFEPRTQAYLIDGFAQYVPEASENALWNEWAGRAQAFEALGIGAFQGTVNLHEHRDALRRLRAIYTQLQADA